MECIGKGKAHKKYKFGVKVSLVVTSKEDFVIGAQALHGNPYDGHTLCGALRQAGQLAGRELRGDMSLSIWATTGTITRGAGAGERGRAQTQGNPEGAGQWDETAGGDRTDHRAQESDRQLSRNFLLSKLGDKLNAVLIASGHNLRLMLAKMRAQEG